MSLRSLDDRYVPALARYVQRKTDRLVRRLPPSVRQKLAEPLPPPRPRGPAGPAPVILRLRGVDDRYARRGPLALMREVPQLGAFALALLVLVSGATVYNRRTDQRDQRQEQGTGPGGGPAGVVDDSDNQVGPQLGDNVEAYLSSTREVLAERLGGSAADTLTWSVVSFERYLSVPQLVAITADMQTYGQFVVFRVPPTSREVQSDTETVAVRNPAKDLPAIFAATVRAKLEEAASAESTAATAENDPAQQADYIARARQLRAEAAILQRGCACIYGVIVKARPTELALVAARDGVRAVDLGPAGAAYDELTFRVLMPEERVTVTGGNEGIPGG